MGEYFDAETSNTLLKALSLVVLTIIAFIAGAVLNDIRRDSKKTEEEDEAPIEKPSRVTSHELDHKIGSAIAAIDDRRFEYVAVQDFDRAKQYQEAAAMIRAAWQHGST
jgi:hypothetical protein